MQQQLNLVEALKNAPKGTPLWSPICGECIFEGIKMDVDPRYPVWVLDKSDCRVTTFTKEGRYTSVHERGECVLWPSKDNQSWENWRIPFKAGDFVYRVCTSGNTWISIHKAVKDKDVETYVDLDLEENNLFLSKKDGVSYENYTLCWTHQVKEERLATPEEKEQLLRALWEKGYIWNTDKLCLDKIPTEQHCTLKPFDKVLVRDTDSEEWKCAIFSHISFNKNYFSRYVTETSCWKQCIPYEDNEHLVGTTNDPDYSLYSKPYIKDIR